jgi:circadian clock protein KaiB
MVVKYIVKEPAVRKTGARKSKELKAMERAVAKQGKTKYVLRLYIAGITPRSTQAVLNIRNLCEEYLRGRFDLEVIDIYQQPILAEGEQIIAAPTLIKKLPLPLRRFIGDLSNIDRILVGLDLRKEMKGKRKRE